MLQRVRRALRSTKNRSAAGPDNVSWRLLKMISTTHLGRQLERDVVRMADVRNRLRVHSQWRDLMMIMIPKPGKDHTKVKGWRPIVVANTMVREGGSPGLGGGRTFVAPPKPRR